MLSLLNSLQHQLDQLDHNTQHSINIDSAHTHAHNMHGYYDKQGKFKLM